MMKTVLASLLCLGLVTGFSFVREESQLTASEGKDKAIELDWHDSIGLVCYDADSAVEIAKVFCGGAGSAITVTSPTYEDEPEFSLTGMKCQGDESSLSECAFDESGIQGYGSCATGFVGAECETADKREDMVIRGIF